VFNNDGKKELIMKFHHFGIPLPAKKEGMSYGDTLKVWFTDASASPHNVEFLYFDRDCPLAATVQNCAHVAYTVDNIEEAVKGKNILLPVTEIVSGFKIAFIFDGDIPIELMQVG